MSVQQLILFNIVTNLVRYFVIAGSMYLVFYVLQKSKWAHRKIQSKYPDTKQVMSEIQHSLISIFIFALVGLLLFECSQLGWAKIYWDIHRHGLLYFWLSIPLLIFIHDTYFYWSHRALHHPRLMRFHVTHHHSHNTTPFTAFSFHPVEAVVQTGFMAIVFILPVNVYVFAIVMFWQMIFNVLGHLGFEIFPKKLHRHVLGKQFNTVTHHNMHHRFTNSNFSLYFNFWDKLMKTNHKEYEQHYHINATKMFNH